MATLVWFRHDLRVADNPALVWACKRGAVIPVYVLDEETPGVRALGSASKWWLHHSLKALEKSLGGLVVKRGKAANVIAALAKETGANAVCWNRMYEGGTMARDKDLKAALERDGVEVATFNGSLLHEPWEIKNGSGNDFKVFTPYWKACLQREIAAPLPAPNVRMDTLPASETIEEVVPLPTKPAWAEGWGDIWQVGERAAMARLEDFMADDLQGYAEGRDRPDKTHFSRLSPHLRFGEISPRQVWQMVKQRTAAKPGLRKDADKFLAEVGWREFAHHILYHFPALATDNWKAAFDAYPWENNKAHLKAWQRGRTGYPFVDAGMRELWQTGFLHNRVRMVVASFLIKHLRLDWRLGEDWFWDTLCDADTANNAAGWQWVAGSGADASPYFRIFNPFGQGEKFDPDGAYVRRWVPELAGLPNDYIHRPWEAPPLVLAQAGVVLGKDYPFPLVKHEEARAAALAGYGKVKGGVVSGGQ
jgi:deoxyribodipyrimidine photo-lyase